MRKKWMAILAAAVSALMLFLSGCNMVEQMSYAYSGSVNVTVGMGTRSSFSAGKKASVCVEITGEYASGENTVTLTVPTNENDYYCYRRQIGKEGSDRAVFVVPVSRDSSQMVVEILDAKERVIYSRTCYYQFASMEDMDGELVIGMVGSLEDAQLWNLTHSDGSLRYQVRTAFIKPENLLEVPEAYQVYALLVIDGEAESRMTPAQKAGIVRWQEEGGSVLVLGTVEEARDLGFSMDELAAKYQPLDNVYVLRYKSGRGTVCLMDRDVFTGNYTENDQITLLDNLLGGNLEQELQTGKNDSSVGSVMKEELDAQETVAVAADRRIYYGIFVIYLLIVLPGVYLLLRRKDKMRFFRIFVCTAACLVSAIIWAAGSRTRFSEPFLHSIVVESYNGDRLFQSVFFSIQAPYNQSYEISLNPEYRLEPLETGDKWAMSARNNYDRHTAEITESREELSVKLDNLIAFSPRYFKLLKQEYTDRGVSAAWKDTDAEAAVLTNGMGTDLRNVLIQDGETLYLVREWKNGEDIDLSEAGQQGDCQKITREQFLNGAWRGLGGWETGHEEIYSELLTRSFGESEEPIYVIAQTDGETGIQKETSYRQNCETIVQVTVSEGR